MSLIEYVAVKSSLWKYLRLVEHTNLKASLASATMTAICQDHVMAYKSKGYGSLLHVSLLE